MDLKDKKILVTGSSSGIGQATAIAFARKGAIILVNFRSDKKGAEETLREVRKHSIGYGYKADLTRKTDVEKMFSRIKKDVGGITWGSKFLPKN